MNSDLTSTSAPQENAWEEIFADLPDLNDFDEYKKIEIAADMAALLVHSGHTRAEVARLLGWTRSRVTNVLSGDANPTLKTVFEFSRALGYDFDLTYRKSNVAPPHQPWVSNSKFDNISLVLQSAHEVRSDFDKGLQRDVYFSIGPLTSSGGVRIWAMLKKLKTSTSN